MTQKRTVIMKLISILLLFQPILPHCTTLPLLPYTEDIGINVVVPSCGDLIICWLALSPIYQHLVEQTRLYASQAINAVQYPITGHTFHQSWVPMTVEEIKFLGLTFTTGVINKPKLKCLGQIILFWTHQYFLKMYFCTLMTAACIRLIPVTCCHIIVPIRMHHCNTWLWTNGCYHGEGCYNTRCIIQVR